VRGRTGGLAAGVRQVNGDFGSDLIQIRPTRIGARGIDTDAYGPNSRSFDASSAESGAT
jgi:hypothetical protein